MPAVTIAWTALARATAWTAATASVRALSAVAAASTAAASSACASASLISSSISCGSRPAVTRRMRPSTSRTLRRPSERRRPVVTALAKTQNFQPRMATIPLSSSSSHECSSAYWRPRWIMMLYSLRCSLRGARETKASSSWMATVSMLSNHAQSMSIGPGLEKLRCPHSSAESPLSRELKPAAKSRARSRARCCSRSARRQLASCHCVCRRCRSAARGGEELTAPLPITAL